MATANPGFDHTPDVQDAENRPVPAAATVTSQPR